MSEKLASPRKPLAVQMISSFVAWLDFFLIFSVPAFAWKASPSEVAVVASLLGLPSLVIGPFLGAWVDRSDPKRLMVWGAVARACISFGLAFAGSFGIFCSLVLARGLANSLYGPAAGVLTNRLVAPQSRMAFYSVLSGADQLIKVGTPLLAAVVGGFVPTQSLFVLSAFASLVCVLTARSLPWVYVPAGTIAENRGWWATLHEGYSSIVGFQPDLKRMVLVSLCLSLTLAVYDPHLAGYLSFLGLQSSDFSIALSATATGAMLAAGAVRLRYQQKHPVQLARAGSYIFACAVIGFTLLANVHPQSVGKVAIAAFWLANGFGYELVGIASSVNFQNLCPPAMLGRVGTTVRSLQLAGLVIGPAVGAFAIQNLGRLAPFWMASCIALVLVSITLRWRSGDCPRPTPDTEPYPSQPMS